MIDWSVNQKVVHCVIMPTSSFPPGVPGPPALPSGFFGGFGFGTGFFGPTGVTFVPVAPPPAPVSVPPALSGLSPVAPPLPPSSGSGVDGPPGFPESGLPHVSSGILVLDSWSLTSLPPIPLLSGSIVLSVGGPFIAKTHEKNLFEY